MASLKDYLTTYKDLYTGKTNFKDVYNAANSKNSGMIGPSGGAKKKDYKNPDEGTFTPMYSNKQYGPEQVAAPKTSKKSGGSGGGSINYGGIMDSLSSQKDDAAAAMEKRRNAYGKLYDQIKSNLVARRGEVGTERDNALSAMDSDYNNAMTRANSNKEEMGEYYDNQEDTLNKSYDDQRKERERIFTGRNIINSSYYIDAVTDADKEFNKTLSSLNKDEARNILEIDTQIKEIETERMTKRTEIETAYQQAIREIETDITRTDVEKADAFERLNSEYDSKIGTIDQQLLSIQTQQQAYRQKVASMSFETGYQNTQYGIDLNNDSLQMKTPAANAALLKALMSTKGEDGYVNPDEYARLRTTVTANPTTFDNKFGSYVNPVDMLKLGISGAKSNNSKKSLEDEFNSF